MRHSALLVIGVGNRHRSDDAVGPVVADVFDRRDDVASFVVSGDLSDLCMRWERHQRVVVVDAMLSGRRPGMLVQLDALDERLPIGSGVVSSHGVGLAEAIELGRMLDRLPEQLTILAVEAASFATGDELTTEVAQALPLILSRIERALGLSSREYAPSVAPLHFEGGTSTTPLGR